MADYLVHFNKNHDHKNGQFTFGDGDGDGTRDDHHAYSKDEIKRRMNEIGKKAGLSDKEIKKTINDYLKKREKIGSSDTVKKYDKLMVDTDLSVSSRKALKRLKDYDKSARKDIKKAEKIGDEEAANLINAGRMFTNALISYSYEYKYLNDALDQYQRMARIKDPTSVRYEIEQNDSIGGVDVILNVDGKKETLHVKEWV